MMRIEKALTVSGVKDLDGTLTLRRPDGEADAE